MKRESILLIMIIKDFVISSDNSWKSMTLDLLEGVVVVHRAALKGFTKTFWINDFFTAKWMNYECIIHKVITWGFRIFENRNNTNSNSSLSHVKMNINFSFIIDSNVYFSNIKYQKLNIQLCFIIEHSNAWTHYMHKNH